jgi:hypothetical protein
LKSCERVKRTCLEVKAFVIEKLMSDLRALKKVREMKG